MFYTQARKKHPLADIIVALEQNPLVGERPSGNRDVRLTVEVKLNAVSELFTKYSGNVSLVYENVFKKFRETASRMKYDDLSFALKTLR